MVKKTKCFEEEFDNLVEKNFPGFKLTNCGYPDRVLFNGEKVIFVEIKGPNDKLRDSQRFLLSVLSKNFDVLIAKHNTKEFTFIPFQKYIEDEYFIQHQGRPKLAILQIANPTNGKVISEFPIYRGKNRMNVSSFVNELYSIFGDSLHGKFNKKT